MKDIKDNSLEFKLREKVEKPKVRVLKKLAVTMSVIFEYEDADHVPDKIQGYHELDVNQLFSLPQGPMFMLAHMFSYIHNQLFVRMKEHMQTLYSNDQLHLQEEEAAQAQQGPTVVPGPGTIQ